jgi:hypothetical protein
MTTSGDAHGPSVAEATTADLRDLVLVLARSVTDTGRRLSLDDVLTAFGHTRESLAAMEEHTVDEVVDQ